jgi:probable HAF family extracellular repeat protein
LWYSQASVNYAINGWIADPAGTSPVALPQSASDTLLQYGGGDIVDARKNQWTINSKGQVVENGVADTDTANVIALAYVNGLVWQENSSHTWWAKQPHAPGNYDGWTSGPGTDSSAGTGISPVPPPETSYTFVQVSVPGESATVVNGLNNNGEIVGQMSGSTSGLTGDPYPSPFIDINGVVTEPSLPSTEHSTYLDGVNDFGAIAGSSTGQYEGLGRGFFGTAGAYTTVSPPVSGLDTTVNGINDLGQVVGAYVNSMGSTGFVDDKGTITQISAFGAYSTTPNAINNPGEIVGTYIKAGAAPQGFVDNNGQLATIAVPGAADTVALGVNDAGIIVGSFTTDLQTHGFLYQDGKFAELDVPGAFDTTISGINNADEIAGSYMPTVNGPVYGFIASLSGSISQYGPIIGHATTSIPLLPSS